MKRFISVVVLSVLVFSGISIAFDNVPGVGIDIGKIKNAFPVITSIGEAYGYSHDHEKSVWVKGKANYKIMGSGFVLLGEFIVTANHVIVPDFLEISMTRNVAYQTEPVEFIWGRVFAETSVSLHGFIPLEVVYSNREDDIAVLKFDYKSYGYAFESINFKLPDTISSHTYCGLISNIEAKDSIASVVHKRDNKGELLVGELEVIYGVVIGGRALAGSGVDLTSLGPEDFTMFIDVHGGDSGSPIIAWKNSSPIVIGVLRAISDEYTYAVRTDKVRKIIGMGVRH